MRRKRRLPLLGAAFLLLAAFVAFFFIRLGSHRPPSVELPVLEQGGGGEETAASPEQGTLRRVEVTPQTVQLVIERLARPANYRRTVAVERYWSGISGVSTALVSAADGWTRVDLTNGNGETRHSIVSPAECWIWYDETDSVYHGAAALSADEEQSIPTYENILRLDAASIAAADYRALDELNCIYVETVPDGAGYTDRYYISVESGLLVSMERAKDGAAAYRMSALTVERDAVDAAAFTLPDGTVLHDPQQYEESEGG